MTSKALGADPDGRLQSGRLQSRTLASGQRGNAQAGLRWLLAKPRNRDEVQQALTHAGEVISRIRALIKTAPPSKDRLEINGVILEVVELTRGEAVRNGISISTDLADNLPAVEVHRVQLLQVLVNLIVNAIEAMGATRTRGSGPETAMLERAFEVLLYDETDRLGDGALNLPFDHRGAWWTTLGSSASLERTVSASCF